MTTDETPEQSTDPGRRRTWLIVGILAGLVILGLVVLGIWAATQPQGSPTPAPTSSRPSASASASPTPTPTASPSGEPTPAPTETVPAAPVPDPALDSADEVDTSYEVQQPVTEGLAIRVSSVQAVQGTADEPGEIAGPSLQFTIDFVNSTGETVSLRDVAINVDYGQDRTPALELREDATSPVPGEVGPNSTVSGTYVFNVPTDGRDIVRLTVFTTVDDPVIAFSGPAPR
ncbi:hypothetical protein [Naasia sp. SYSU D00057]|uniref:hypothetical protein n=1 Tax=Naasia sp. SYSU D00057 TaxID=2817380 RepID=UPI001B30C1BC|nr:hypothetical protein [Naasia sp. SYSU D00057]